MSMHFPGVVESSIPVESQITARRGLSHWLGLIWLAGIVLVAAIICAIGLGLNTYRGPANFRDASTADADTLRQTLIEAGIPAASILRSDPELRSEDNAVWYSYNFTVDLKDEIKADAVKDLIRRRMPQVKIEDAVGPPPVKIALAIDSRDFALVQLNEKERNTDLTPACADVDKAIETFLTAYAAVEGPFRKSAPEARQEDTRSWTYARYEAVLPVQQKAEEAASDLQAAVAPLDAHVAPRLGIRGSIALTVTVQGVPCADVVLSREMPFGGESASLPAEWEGPKLKIAKSDVGGIEDSAETEGLSLDAAESSIPQELKDIPLGQKLNLNLELAQNDAAPTLAAAPDQKPPRVAIIIDDGGFGGAAKDMILALDPRLTLAIMPDGPFTAQVAQKGKERGFQIMLHIPMQGTKKPEGLTPNMSAAEVRKYTEWALSKVPDAVGVNNHMGSITTPHEDICTYFVQVIKDKKNLFIVDSVTTGRSKLLAVARRMGVLSGSRDIFLDIGNHGEAPPPEFVREQFKQMIAMAKRRGQVIAIAHFRKSTAELLTEMLPDLEKNGVKLVHASELVR